MRENVGWMAAALSLVALSPAVVAQTKPATVERVGDAPDKVICKTFPVTGSLALTRKVCLTKRDWVAQREALQRSNSIDSCRMRADGGAC